MSKTEMTNKVRELKELKAMADELTAEITAIEDSIKADMTAQGVEEITVDVYKVRYKTVKSSRFDTTAFKKAIKCKDSETAEIFFLPVVDIPMMSDYRWQLNCLKSRLEHPEIYAADEDVPAVIERLKRWLAEHTPVSA